MKKIFLFIIVVIVLCQASFCQGQSLVSPRKSSLDAVVSQLEKANKVFSRNIEKFNKKLENRLKKIHPTFEKGHLDSLLTSETAFLSLPSDQLKMIDSAASEMLAIDLDQKITTTVSPVFDSASEVALPDHVTGHFSDSVLLAIHQIKDELTTQLEGTPSQMKLYQQLEASLDKLDKTAALYQQLKLRDLPTAPSISSLSSIKIPETNSWKELVKVNKLESLQKHAKELSGALDQYKNEFEGLDKKLLAAAGSLEEIQWLQEQQQKVAAYQPLPEGYRENLEGFQTNDFVKEQLKKKAEAIAKAGGKPLEERLTKAQDKLADFKKKFTNLESVAEAPKRPPNPMKGKSLKERLRLGGNFQVNRQKPFTIDVSLQLSYLLSDKVSTGIGGACRIATKGEAHRLNLQNEMFGARYHFDYMVHKNFFAQTVLEMNRKQAQSANDASSVIREWVPGAFVGAGKKFRLGKKLNGNMSLLYNLLHHSDSPYPKPLVFRVGFEL